MTKLNDGDVIKSSTRMQNRASWVKISKLRFCNHRVGLVETFPTMYNSAMRAPLAKPPQAPQVPSTGSLGGDIATI